MRSVAVSTVACRGCGYLLGGNGLAEEGATFQSVTQAATIDALAKAASASADLRKSGMKEALDRLFEHQRMLPQQTEQRDRLLAQLAEIQKTAFKLPPGYEKQLKEIAGVSAATEQVEATLKAMLAQSGLGERLSKQIQASIAQSITPSWDSIADTAEALTSAEKEELESVVSAVGDELRSTTEPVDDSSEAALSPISGPVAAWLAAVAVSAVLAMLLRWTDFQISQADQATLDVALDLLSGIPAWRSSGADESDGDAR